MEHEERNLAEAAMHTDLQRRVEDMRDRVARVEAQLQEAVGRMEVRLRSRDEDLAELREEMRTARPKLPIPGCSPEVVAGIGGGSAPEEAGPDPVTILDLAELLHSTTAGMSEQVRRQQEVAADISVRMAVLERQLQESLERLSETQEEQLSENMVLRRRVGRVEADLQNAFDEATSSIQRPGELGSRVLEACGSEGMWEPSHPAGSSTAALPRRGSKVDIPPLESVQELPEAEECRLESPPSLSKPRLSILKGGELDPSPATTSSAKPLFRRSNSEFGEAGQARREEFDGQPVVRRNNTDLQEVMRRRREQCQEWVSPGDRPKVEAAATSPNLADDSTPSTLDSKECSQERPQEEGSPAASLDVLAPSTPIGVCKEEPEDSSPLACRIQALEGRLEAGDKRIEDIQAGFSLEISALQDLVEALPKPGEPGQISEAEVTRLAAASDGLDLRLAALERCAQAGEGCAGGEQETQQALVAELRNRVESLAVEVASRVPPEPERASLAEEAQALSGRVKVLEARLQDGLSELRQRSDAEVAKLRCRVERVEGDQHAQPPEQSPEATSPDTGAATLPVEPPKQADELDLDIEELGRRLEGSDSRIEEMMKRMLAESGEGSSKEVEQQAAGAKEASQAQAGRSASKAKAPAVKALQLPAVPVDAPADERPSGSETRRALEALRARLVAEAEGLRERLEVHAERCDERIRGFHEEHGKELAEAMKTHHEEVSRSTAQHAPLEEEQRRLAGEASKLWQRLQVLEEVERRERQEQVAGVRQCLEEVAAAGQELAQAWKSQHDEVVSQSDAQRALLEEEQRRMAVEASTLVQRLEVLEAECRERQASEAVYREDFAEAFGAAAAGLEEPMEAPTATDVARVPCLPAPAEDPDLAVLRGRVEVLALEQGQQISRTEEHQEALDSLQAQVGVLETCLEANDGKLTEIQTTLLEARLEGLVAIDDRVKSLESKIQASSASSASPPDGFPREGGILPGRPRPLPLSVITAPSPCPMFLTEPPNFFLGRARSCTEAAAQEAARSAEVLGGEHLRELRRYVDDRLRKLQSILQDHQAHTAELRRRLDSAAQRGPPSAPATSAPQAPAAGLAPDVVDRLQAVEGKCSTILSLLLKL